MDPLFIMVARTLYSFRIIPLVSYGPMMRYVQIEVILVLIMCFRESYE